MHSNIRKRALAYVLAFVMVLTTVFSNSNIFVNATDDKNIRYTSIDDFENYSDGKIGSTWTRNTGGSDVTPSTVTGVTSSTAMKYDYTLGEYAGIGRSCSVKATDYEGLQLWYKPDGSGNRLVLQLKSGDNEYEKSITLSGTDAQTIKIPFSDFILKGSSDSFEGKSASQFFIYVNKEDSGAAGDHTLYFDDISVYRTVTPVENVTIDQGNFELEIGSTQNLSATISPSNATVQTVEWTSGDDSIVSIAKGVATAKAAGTTTITATVDGVSTTCIVTVTGKKPIIIDSFDTGVSGWAGAVGSDYSGVPSVSYNNVDKALQVAVQYDGTNNSEARIYKNLDSGVKLNARSYLGYQITYPEELDGKFAAKIYGSSATRTQDAEIDTSVTPSTTKAPATTQTPATTQGSNDDDNSNGGLYIDGSKLKTAGGQEIVMRGVNLAHVFYRDRSMTDLKKISDLGANAVRIVLTNGAPAGNGWQKEKNTPSDIEPLVKFCKENGMVVVLDDQTTTGGDSTSYLDDAVSYWLEMKDFMNQYKDCVVLNIANEWSGKWVSDNPNYTSAYVDAVKKLRNAGIENVLMVDAAGWGQDIMGLAGVAQTILAADTTGNTMFSGHMYCYGAPDESGVKERIDAFTNKNLCFCVGEFGWKHNPGSIPYKYIMSYAQENCAGWLAWSWYGNGAEGSYLAQGELDLVDSSNNLKSPWGTDVAEQWKNAPRYSFTGSGNSNNNNNNNAAATTTQSSSTGGAITTNGGMYVDGSDLKAADGTTFTMRGLNINHAWYKDRTMDAIKKSGELGSNTARIVMSDGTCPNWHADPESASSLESIIKACRESGQVAVVEIHDGTGFDDTKYIDTAVNYWVGVKDVLNKYKDSVIVNIANEWSGSWLSSNSSYTSAYKNAIQKLRNAGIQNVLMIDAPGWGQDIMGLASVASELKAADSTGNTMFSGHMYCYGAPDESGVKQRIDAFKNNNLCFCVGEFGWKHKGDNGAQNIPYEYIMKYCQEVGANWLAWSWYGNGAEGSYLAKGELDLVDSSNNLKSPYGTTVAEQWKGAKKLSFGSTYATTALTTTGLATVISETVSTAQTVAKNATDGGMYVSGSKLYDGDGNEFIMRGVNVTHTWSKDYTERSIKDAGKLGSNCVRVALSDGNAKNFGGKTPLSEIEDIVTWSKESNQICVLELHDYTGNNDAENITTNCVNYWKEIKSFLNANKDYVILNIANEWFGNWDNMVSGTEKNTWKNAYKTAIKSLRDAGIENVIMVDAAGYANDVTTVVRDAKEVLGADANANTMFSYHIYSSFGGDVVTDGGGTGAAIKAGMDKLGATGVCYCIGEFGYWQNGGEVDERTILDYSEQKGIGWLAWSWGGNGAGTDSCLDMTLDTTYSGDDLTDWGKWVYGTKNGIQATSKLAYSCKSYSGTKVSGTIPDSMPKPTFQEGADISSSDTAGIDCGIIKDYEWVTAHNVDNDPTPWKTMKLGKLENGGLTITDIDYSADKDATFQIESPEGMDISSHKTLDLVVRNNNTTAIQLDLIIKGGEFQFDNGIGSAWAETKSIDQTQLQNGRNHYINIPKNKTVHIQFSISPEYLDTGYDAEQILSDVKYLALRVQSGSSSSDPIDKSLDIISMGFDWADDKYEHNIAELNRPKTVCKWVWNRKDFSIGSTPTYSQDNEAGTLTINYDIQDDKGTGLQAQTNPGGDSKVGEDWTPYKSVTATLENKGDKEVHVTFLCRCGSLWRWAENSGYDDNGRTPAEECIIGPNEKVNVRYLLNEATWRTEDSNFAATDSLTDLDIVKTVAFKIYTDGGTPASGTLTVSNFQANFGETADDNPVITPTPTPTPTPSVDTFVENATITNKVNNGDGTITAFVYAPMASHAITAKSLTLGFVGSKACTGNIKVDNIQLCDEIPEATEPNPSPVVTTEKPDDKTTETPVGNVTTQAPVVTTETTDNKTTQAPTVTTEKPDNKTTQAPVVTTEKPDNKTTQAPVTTTEKPDNKTTQAPVATTEKPDNKTTQAPVSTTEKPDNKTTQAPAATTEKPADTTESDDVKVNGVSLSKDSVSLVLGGDSETITATVSPKNATNKDVTWKVANSKVATVTNGKIEAVGVGETTVSVTTVDGNFTAQCTVYVTKAEVKVTGVSFKENSITLAEGDEQALTYTVSPVTASNQNVEFESDNEDVVSVDAKGVVTAVAEGTATITVKTVDGNFTDTITVKVEPKGTVAIKVQDVTLEPETLSIVVGDKETLAYEVLPENASNKNVTWYSSNEAVAKVTNGVVEAISAGEARIRVKTEDGNYSATCKVTVTDAVVPVTGVSFKSGNKVTLTEGTSQKLAYTVEPEDATNKAVEFTTTNEDVASVDAKGVVTALAEGTATITVKTVDGNKKATIKVTVEPKSVDVEPVKVTSIILDPAMVSIVKGKTQTIKATVAPANADNTNIVWEVADGDENIVSVSSKGVVTAKAVGEATVYAKSEDGNCTAACTVYVTKDTVPVTGVTIKPTTLQIAEGGQASVSATVSPADASNQNVEYESEDENIAIVDADGKITAISAGTTTITVKTVDGGYTAECEITVIPEDESVPVEGVKVTLDQVTLKVNETKTLKATITPSGATNKAVEWKSSKEDVVTVVNGKLTAKKAGDAIITVTTVDGSYVATCKVTVEADAADSTEEDPTTEKDPSTEDVKATSVVIDDVKDLTTMTVGDKLTLSATVTPSKASQQVTWSTSNKNVATVTNGTVKAVAKGVVTITATSVSNPELTASVTIVINEFVDNTDKDNTTQDTDKDNTTQDTNKDSDNGNTTQGTNKEVQVTAVTLDKSSVTLAPGATQKVTATVAPSDATNKTVKYTSMNTAVATVSEDGTITAVAAGTTTIIATSADGQKSAFCSVTVAENSIALNAQEVTLLPKKSTQLTATVSPAGAEVVWVTSDASVVTVDATGKVTAVAPGVATIIAQTKDGKSSTICQIIVKPLKVTKLKKAMIGKTSVKLSWKKQSGVKGYKIYKYNTKTKKYTVCKTLKKNVKSVTIKGLKKNTKYQFKVAAFTENGDEIILGAKSSALKVKTSRK